MSAIDTPPSRSSQVRETGQIFTTIRTILVAVLILAKIAYKVKPEGKKERDRFSGALPGLGPWRSSPILPETKLHQIVSEVTPCKTKQAEACA
jgi:hypothetical protein